MGFLSDLFGNSDEEAEEITLKEIDFSFIIKYLDDSWIVKDINEIDFDGKATKEFVLNSETGKTLQLQYLEAQNRYRTYEIIPIHSDVRSQFQAEMVPKHLKHEEASYFLNETGSGEMNGDLPFMYWEFIDKKDKSFMRVEQYNDDDFSCLVGQEVDPNHFEIMGDSSE